MTDLLHRAAVFAAKAHEGHLRYFVGTPYIEHPNRVAALLAAHGHDDVTVAAGYLHDTIEDTKTTYADLVAAFGEPVAALVAEVTHPADRTGNRAARKARDHAHYAKASYAGASIKLADMIDNLSDLRTVNPRFYRVYAVENRKLHPLLAHGDPALHEKVGRLLNASG